MIHLMLMLDLMLSQVLGHVNITLPEQQSPPRGQMLTFFKWIVEIFTLLL